jgi:hypothetical protein
VRHQFLILAYGTSPHLDACIQSIAGQTATGVVAQVATSTPNDHIVETAARHGLQVLENPVKGGGISVDWNFALKAADAELVTLAHQDDVYESTYSESMVHAMSRHPESLIGFTDFVEVSPEGICSDSLNNKVKRLLVRRAFGAREAINECAQKRKLLSLGNPVCCPSVVFNRVNLGSFEFLEGYKSNLDWEAWLRLSDKEGSFVHVPEVLVKKRNHSLSATAALLSSRHRLNEDRVMFEQLWPKPIASLLTLVYRLGYIGNMKADRQQGTLAGNEQHT